MRISICRPSWQLTLEAVEDGVSVVSGRFGGVSLAPSPLFTLVWRDLTSGLTSQLDSRAGFERVVLREDGGDLSVSLTVPGTDGKLTVSLCGAVDLSGISWRVKVTNDCQTASVMSVGYPSMAVVREDGLSVFVPEESGRVLTGDTLNGLRTSTVYPSHRACMAYHAFWTDGGGLYAGVHDGSGAVKKFKLAGERGAVRFEASCPAVGAGLAANSFAPAGVMRWQAFAGDWFDATRIYEAFVKKEAGWLPAFGRPDTPERFRKIGFWVADYIPNSPEQGDARPMTLAAVSERYGENYWYEAPIGLAEALGQPVAYHIYNWHEIPFNIDYPHFLPGRERFADGLRRLKEAGVLAFPYINALSWEKDDADEGFAENFANTGRLGAAVNEAGEPFVYQYPQIKKSGAKTGLVPMCPTFARWRQIIREVTRGIERDYPVDGVYFDQIAAHAAEVCMSHSHGHLPGGGSYWVEGWNRMMEEIGEDRPADSFYFTECHAEPYMRSFDGFLTWFWTSGDYVPAFSRIYAGYIQMIGRYTDGARRDDEDYFRFHLAESLLFGQQLGWLNACVLYNDERMCFLKKIVSLRAEYEQTFDFGRLLRPAAVQTALEPVASTDLGGASVRLRQILSASWQSEDGKTVHVFAVNLSRSPVDVTLRLYPEEYGTPEMPRELTLTLDGSEVRVLSFARTEETDD